MSYVLVYSVRFHYFVFQAFAHGKYLWSTGAVLPSYIPLRIFFQETTEAESTSRMVANVTSSPFLSRILIACRFPPTACWPQLPRYLVDEFLFACKDSWSPILVRNRLRSGNGHSQELRLTTTIVLHSIKIGRIALANMGTSGETILRTSVIVISTGSRLATGCQKNPVLIHFIQLSYHPLDPE
jgi:hypothetical protein